MRAPPTFWVWCFFAAFGFAQDAQPAIDPAGEVLGTLPEARVLVDHSVAVRSLACGEGDAGFLGLEDGRVVSLMHPETGDAWTPLGPRAITGLALLPSGLAVATSSSVGLGTPGGDVRQVALPPDTECLAVAVTGVLAFGGSSLSWIPNSGSPRALAWGDAAPTSLSIGPRGDTFVAADEDGFLHLWGQENAPPRKIAAHSKVIDALAWSKDGRVLASGSEDGTVRLWDVSELRELRRLLGHLSGVSALAFSNDGAWLASGTWGHEVHLWNLRTGHCERVLRGHSRPITALAFRADSKALVSGSMDGTVREWPVAIERELRWLSRHRRDVNSVAWSPDGALLATGSADGVVRVWDATAGSMERELAEHEGPVTFVTFSRDGRAFASASIDGTVRLWDVQSWRCTRVLAGHDGRVTSVAFHPTEPLVVTGASDRLGRLFDTRTGALVRMLEGHRESVKAVVFSDDGTRVLTGCADGGTRVFDPTTGKLEKTLATGRPYEHVHGLSFSPDGKLLATGTLVGLVFVWDFEHGTLVRTFEGHVGSVESVGFHPSGQLLVSSSADGTVRFWDVEGGERHVISGHGLTVYQARFSPDGNVVATCSSDQTVRIWSVPDGRLLRRLPDEGGPLLAVACSLDGRVAFGGENSGVRLWAPRGEPRITTLANTASTVRALAFCGDLLAVGSEDASIRIFDGQGRLVTQFDGKTPQRALAFRRDGKLLACGGTGESIRLFEVGSKEPVADLSGHLGYVLGLAFTPDGNTLVSSSEDASVRLWNVEERALLQEINGFGGAAQSVAVNPQGTHAAVGVSDGKLHLFDLKNPDERLIFEAHHGGVNALVFSPDGRSLISVGADHALRRWNVEDGRALGVAYGARARVTGIAWCGTSSVASVSDDGVVSTHDVLESGFRSVAEGRVRDHGAWAVFSNGRVWRGLLGEGLLRRQEPGGAWTRVPPSSVRGTSVSINVPAPLRLRPAIGAVSTVVEVKNTGAEPLFWGRIVPGSPAPKGLTLVGEGGIARLDPGATVRLTVWVSAATFAPDLPRELPIVFRAEGGLSATATVPCQVLAPRLAIKSLTLERDPAGRPLSLRVEVENTGDLDPEQVSLELSFNTALALGETSVPALRLYGLAPGTSTDPLPIAVPATIAKLPGPLSVNVLLSCPLFPGLRFASRHDPR